MTQLVNNVRHRSLSSSWRDAGRDERTYEGSIGILFTYGLVYVYTHTHTSTHIRTHCTKWIAGAVPLYYQAMHVLRSAIKASRENTPCNLWLADPSARVAFYSGVLDSRIYREYSGKKACIFSTRDYVSSLALPSLPPSRERERERDSRMWLRIVLLLRIRSWISFEERKRE